MPGTKVDWYEYMPATLLEAITAALPGFQSEQLVARDKWPQSTLYRVYLKATGETTALALGALDTQINALQKANLKNDQCVVASDPYCQWPNPMTWNPTDKWVASVNVDIPVNTGD